MNPPVCVPTTLPTVVTASIAVPVSALAEHTTDVPDAHDAVLQLRDPSPAVAVASLLRKSSPLTVKSPPSLLAVFSGHVKLTTGAASLAGQHCTKFCTSKNCRLAIAMAKGFGSIHRQMKM